MTFAQIFKRYYAGFRGNASNVPVWNSKEYLLGIELANEAIDDWADTDNEFWNELEKKLQAHSTAVKTVTGTSIAAPDDMRIPPAHVRVYQGASEFFIPVIEPEDRYEYSEDSSLIWFEGGATGGYTMKLSSNLATLYNAWNMDYVYWKNPTYFSNTADPANTKPDMSKPMFIVHHMIAARAEQARNGFLFKTRTRAKEKALVDMKNRNASSRPNRPTQIKSRRGWGVGVPHGSDFRL